MTFTDAHIAFLRDLQARFGQEARARLSEFRAVPRERWFYELCFCLMTPQSSAVQCEAVASELERRNFLDRGFDPAPLLRSFRGGYVRFHNTKAQRLLEARENAAGILDLLSRPGEDRALRDLLAKEVKGLGMKEASHLLRNIGRGQLAIVDRHIIRALLALDVLEAWPASLPPRRYREIEDMVFSVAENAAIPVDELDLLLWKNETGFILK